MLAVITTTEMFIPILPHYLGIEPAAVVKIGFTQEIFSPIAHRSAQPITYRNAEARLWSFKQFLRHITFQYTAQWCLTHAELNLGGQWQAPS